MGILRSLTLGCSSFGLKRVNGFLLLKQHLVPRVQGDDIVSVVKDICALHSTVAFSPYLSLWSRVSDFDPVTLDVELHETKRLARLLCMRRTLHVVASESLPVFFQALAKRQEREVLRQLRKALALAGVCQEGEEEAVLDDLFRRTEEVLRGEGPSTLAELTRFVPALGATITHSAGKSYAGKFSLGSRLIPAMCAVGLVARGRPRGTRHSNLYEYAAMADWLPDLDLESVSPEVAQTELLRRYLAAFGPATLDDAKWWTGLSKTEISKAWKALAEELETVVIDGLDGEHLMLANDAQRLRDFATQTAPCVCLLPDLDPYIMGYRDRRRFLASEHRGKVFDRAGNAMSTVWVNGRVVGAWRQRKDGSVAHGLFEQVSDEESALLVSEVRRLEEFLDGESLSPRTHTPFTRALLEA
jgi:hypothetical protein